MTPKVIVIGHGYTSRLGVIRSLGKEGYDVFVIVLVPSDARRVNKTRSTPIDCCSKYVKKVFYCPSDRECLVNLLLNDCVDKCQKAVIIPDSDFSASTIDLFQERLKDHFLFPHINHEPGAVVAWMDKMRQKELAASLGLNVSKGWKIDVHEGACSIPLDLYYPCFPKPLATIVGGKGGLHKCVDEKELKSAIGPIIKKNPSMSFLVEEFKDIETEYALLGFSDGRNVIVPGLIQILSIAHGAHFGVAKQGRIFPTTGFDELVGLFKEFVLHTGFVGIFDIDFYKSGGRFFFCEMNFRYGGSGYAYSAAGVNLPVMLVKSLSGEEIGAMQQEVYQDEVFVNERMCLEDWYNGFITTKEYKQLKASDISFIYDREDIGPQRRYESFYRKLFIKRAIKRLCGRRV